MTDVDVQILMDEVSNQYFLLFSKVKALSLVPTNAQ
jgi:hypothetical protein